MRVLAVLFLSFTIITCAHHQPPKYLYGVYTNPKQNYKIELPSGWDQCKEWPAWLTSFPVANYKDCDLVISNRENNGIIIICSGKILANLEKFNENQRSDFFFKFLDEQREKIESQPSYSDYRAEIISTNIDGAPNLIYTQSSRLGNKELGLRLFVEGYSYTCNGDDTCFLEVFLISKKKSFEANRSQLSQLTNELVPFY